MLKSHKMARFMNRNVAGITVPEPLIERMAKAGDRKKESVAIAVELIEGIKDCCQGIHLMPIGWDDLVPRVLEEAGLLERER